MPSIAPFYRRLVDLVRKDALEREMDDELAFHLEREAEEHLRRGLPPEEARAAARRSLGLPERIKEDCRRQHGFTRLETLWGDLRFALRGLRRQPGFAAAAVVTLALGVGANTALFSVVRGVLLRPLPFPEPDRLVQVLGLHRQDGLERGTISYLNFLDVRREAGSFESLSTYDEWDVLLDWEDGAQKVPGASVSASYFDTLGVAPAAGRFFLPAEDEPGAGELDTLMRRLERAYPEENTDRTMTAVALEEQLVGDVRRPLWVPLAQAELWTWIDGAVLVRTAGDPAALGDGLRRAVQEVDRRIAVEEVLPMTRVVGDTMGRVRFRTALLTTFAGLALALGVVGLYGAVAYATAGRGRELGIRMALGAERRRVLTLVMREGLAPAVAGAAAGLAAALALARLLDGLLFGVGAADPAAVLGATGALLAAAGPALRYPPGP